MPFSLCRRKSPLHPGSISPSERQENLPSYAAFTWGPHMHSDRCINTWSVSPIHRSPHPQCPFLSGPSPSPIRCHTHSVSFSEPPLATIPPRSVSPVSDSTDLCTHCHHPGPSIWHCDAFPSGSSALNHSPGSAPGPSHPPTCPSELATTPVLAHALPQVLSGLVGTTPPVSQVHGSMDPSQTTGMSVMMMNT